MLFKNNEITTRSLSGYTGRIVNKGDSTLGKSLMEKLKKGFTQSVKDIIDFSNPVKQAKVWQDWLKDLQKWVEDVKKNGKKNPSLILNPPLLKTGFKPLDEKILKEIEKKKKELDKYVVDTTIMKPLGLPTIVDAGQKLPSTKPSTPSCDEYIQKLNTEKIRNDECNKNLDIHKNLMKQLAEDTGLYLETCANSNDEILNTQVIDGKKYLICKKKKAAAVPAMTFAQMKAMGLAGIRLQLD